MNSKWWEFINDARYYVAPHWSLSLAFDYHDGWDRFIEIEVILFRRRVALKVLLLK